MDFSSKTMVLAIVLFICLVLPSALDAAAVTCEELDEKKCAFAVSSESKRCILESTNSGGSKAYECKTSDVTVEKISDHIETAACLGACGLERQTVGISSDALLDPSVTQKVCSPGCSQNCPNIIDLYTNLASGEGASLTDLCAKQSANPHRGMAELLSSGAAPGPVSSEADAPSPSA